VTNYLTNFLCDILIFKYKLEVIKQRGGELYIYCIRARSGIIKTVSSDDVKNICFGKLLWPNFFNLANDVIFL